MKTKVFAMKTLLAALACIMCVLGCSVPEERQSQFPARQAQAVSAQANLARVSAGLRHSLSIKPDGTVWTWGSNAQGQLGNGSTATSSTTPVRAKDLTQVKQVAAGYFHSLALDTNGQVWAWGANSQGQLGDTTSTATRRVPWPVTGVSGVRALASGLYHAVVLRADGSVWTWGANTYGQLGDGSVATKRAMPMQVMGAGSAVAVAAGTYHSLALTSTGQVLAWGSNAQGQLGNDLPTNQPVPAPVVVAGLSNVVAIAAGYHHSLALRADGTVWTWGDNTYGQLGDDDTTAQPTPVQVSGLFDAVGLASGSFHSLALRANGTVVSWGSNAQGQLGDGSPTTQPVTAPVVVTGLTNVVSLDGGDTHSMAQLADGTVWTWGNNTYGQLGSGDFLARSSPGQLTANNVTVWAGVGAIAAGGSHSLALRANGTVWAWGYNTYGQLGDNTMNSTSTPLQVPGLSEVVSVGAGKLHSVALRADGTVWLWGQHDDTSGYGWDTEPAPTSPTQVPGVDDVMAVAAGSDHDLLLRANGTVWALGLNSAGQLGNNGAPPFSSSVVQVEDVSGMVAVAAGAQHSLALRWDGTVWSWGNSHWWPEQVDVDSTVAIAASGNTSLALTVEGTVWTWTGDSQPVLVPGLSDVVAIAAGPEHALAQRADGTLWAWGYNGTGQLGDGTTTSRPSPVQLPASPGAVMLAAGASHSLVLRMDGSLWAVGGNSWGQLGNGTTSNSLTWVRAL